MLKRVEIGGFIEIPEGAELPELDQIVTVSELRVQVTGKHEDKQKRRGDTSELVYTRKTTLLDGAQILLRDMERRIAELVAQFEHLEEFWTVLRKVSRRKAS